MRLFAASPAGWHAGCIVAFEKRSNGSRSETGSSGWLQAQEVIPMFIGLLVLAIFLSMVDKGRAGW
jgi:hypothetical protein